MQSMSCYYGNYRAWGKIIAAQGVAVAMVDFRNALTPSSVPEVAPFPAGLNDCVSGVKWVAANAEMLGIDSDRIVIAGESGGGNLTLATGDAALERWGHRFDYRSLRALSLHRWNLATTRKPFIRLRITASFSISITIKAPWPTG